MVQWVGLHTFTVKGLGSILGQGTKIPQAVWHGQKRKKIIITFINNQVLLYSTGNYIQSPGINHNRNGYLKKNVYMYKIELLCYTAEIDTTL